MKTANLPSIVQKYYADEARRLADGLSKEDDCGIHRQKLTRAAQYLMARTLAQFEQKNAQVLNV